MFDKDHFNKKKYTNPQFTGASFTGSPEVAGAELPPMGAASVDAGQVHFDGTEYAQQILTGPNDRAFGTGAGFSETHGVVAKSGSTIVIDDTPGAETIKIIHHSGTGVQIDPDGSIYIASTSRRGVGIQATKGDAYLKSASIVVIDAGGALSIRAGGDLNIDVGGNLNLSVKGAIIERCAGKESTIDGSLISQITNDKSEIIGGVSRETVAGDARVQISGNMISDIGGTADHRTKGNVVHSSEGNISQNANGNVNIGAKGTSTINSNGNMNISSGGTLNQASSGGMNIGSSGALDLSSGAGTKISGSAVDVHGGTIGLNGSASSSAVIPQNGSSPNPSTPPPTSTVSDSPKAEIMEPNDIIDMITSKRILPLYPTNAIYEGGMQTSIHLPVYEGDSYAEQAYNQYTNGNVGNPDTPSLGGSWGQYPETSEGNNNSVSAQSPYSLTSDYNTDTKLSRYFSVGELVGKSHKIPASMKEQVMQAFIHGAYNVLDPLREKFNIILTSAWRGNSKNHITGYAYDIVVESRSLETHAEIARYARDYLPVSQVFLERNTSGRTHVHLRAHPPGASGSPHTLTCRDPACRSSTSGIDVEYLTRKSKR